MKTIFKAITKNDILAINVVSVLLIIIITFLPITALRVVFGLPFLLFLPGYAWVSAFFPRKEQLDRLERILFSTGLSFALVPLTSLVLNITPWGIRLYPLLVSLSVLILAGSLLCWYRRRNLTPEEKGSASLHVGFLKWTKESALTKALTVVLVLTILGSLGVITYFVVNPKVTETFTEFYILGLNGTTDQYPQDAHVGDKVPVTLGIINQEKVVSSYRIEIIIDGVENTAVTPVTLNPGEKWEQPVTFTPTKIGSHQSVEFYIYRDQSTEPYLKPLRLWLNVNP